MRRPYLGYEERQRRKRRRQRLLGATLMGVVALSVVVALAYHILVIQ